MKTEDILAAGQAAPTDHLGAAADLLRERDRYGPDSPGWFSATLPTEQESVTAAAHALAGIGRHLDGISVALTQVAAAGIHVSRTAAVGICVASATAGGAVGALLTTTLGS